MLPASLLSCSVCQDFPKLTLNPDHTNFTRLSTISLAHPASLTTAVHRLPLLQIKRLQHIWRSVIVIRSHQRQLLFMQLQRFASRHANRVVRLGGVLGSSTLSSGDMSSITPLCATRQSTCLASMTRPSSMLRSQAPSAIPQVCIGSCLMCTSLPCNCLFMSCLSIM